MCSQHLINGVLCSTFLKVKSLPRLEFFRMGDLSVSLFIIYLFSHLYRYGLMDVSFILWVIIRHQVYVAQVVPALAMRSFLSMFLCFFGTLLLFCEHVRVSLPYFLAL